MINASIDFTKDTINEKIKNPFWKNFIIGWITWNWEIWYTTFFVSESVSLNRIEYIQTLNSSFFWYSIPTSIWFLINWILVPGLLSFLIVFIITPYISLHFYKKHLKNKEEENIQDTSTNNSEVEKIESETKILSAEIKKREEEMKQEKIKFKEKLEEQRQKLELEFADRLNNTDVKKEYFKFIEKENSKSALRALENIVYNHNWRYSTAQEKRISSTDLRVLDLNGLAVINSPSLEITEKWKDFLKIYSEI